MSQESEVVEAIEPPNVFESLLHTRCCVIVLSKPLASSSYLNSYTNPMAPSFVKDENDEQRG